MTPGQMQPPIYSPLGDIVEGRGRTKIYNNDVALVSFKGGNCIDDSVGAHFSRIVVKNRHPRFDAGTDNEWFYIEVFFTQRFENMEHGWHNAGNDNGLDGLRAHLAVFIKVINKHAVFIDGMLDDGSEPPVMDKIIAIVQTQNGIRVSDINYQ
jgi:hypothetical protein